MRLNRSSILFSAFIQDDPNVFVSMVLFIKGIAPAPFSIQIVNLYFGESTIILVSIAIKLEYQLTIAV